jgi:nucleotide-binding universal stress UspA family protein
VEEKAMTVASTRSRVVVGVDDSPQSIEVARYALEIARERRMDLVLAHAWSFPWAAGYFTADDVRAIGTDARASTAALIEHLDVPAGMNVEVVLAQQPVVQFLRRLSKTSALMVVGRHEHWAERLVNGDVSSGLASSSFCPVITVPTGWTSPEPSAGSVLVCLDGDTSAHGPLEFAFGEADFSGRGLVIFHAVDADRGSDAVETERRDIAEITAGWQERFPGVSVRYELGLDDVGTAIGLAARGAAMVVVGSPHVHRTNWSWLYSLARSVVDRVDCPMVVAPHPAPAIQTVTAPAAVHQGASPHAAVPMF